MRGLGNVARVKIATWNVNSIRARADRVEAWLQRSDVDVLAIQETKAKDDNFPWDMFESNGYEVAHFGLSQWNGVAIASRVGLDDVERTFPGQPHFGKTE
ncbi:MAG: exodeoxyribonuclease, partial [Arthrobacter koreensis]|nr:exodeoxyribonuclease [Arthrobacter koreensis]